MFRVTPGVRDPVATLHWDSSCEWLDVDGIQEAFNDPSVCIVRKFPGRGSSHLIRHVRESIEILPGDALAWSSPDTNDSWPFLNEDGHIGVPEKALLKSYVSVVALNETEWDVGRTSILLLANPFHQTALNRRKQMVLQQKSTLTEELKATELIMMSKSCSRSSILWHHRRWVLRYQYGRAADDGSKSSMQVVSDDTLDNLNIPLAVLQKEINITQKACEIYPRNSYAWYHRGLCGRIMARRKDVSREYRSACLDELWNLTRWIESHISDYSAVHALHCLLASLSPTTFAPDFRVDDHALKMLSEYPQHETSWLYLRNASILLDRPVEVAGLSGDALQQARDSPHFLKYCLWCERVMHSAEKE